MLQQMYLHINIYKQIFQKLNLNELTIYITRQTNTANSNKLFTTQKLHYLTYSCKAEEMLGLQAPQERTLASSHLHGGLAVLCVIGGGDWSEEGGWGVAGDGLNTQFEVQAVVQQISLGLMCERIVVASYWSGVALPLPPASVPGVEVHPENGFEGQVVVH